MKWCHRLGEYLDERNAQPQGIEHMQRHYRNHNTSCSKDRAHQIRLRKANGLTIAYPLKFLKPLAKGVRTNLYPLS